MITGFLDTNRMVQDSRFLKSNLSALILNEIDSNASLRKLMNKLEGDIRKGTISSTIAVELMYKAYLDSLKGL